MRRRRLLWALTVSGCALALAACGASAVEIPTALSGEITLLPGTAESNEAQPATGDFAIPEGGPPPQDEQVRRVSQRWVGLKVGSVGDLDEVLTNAVGLTLYRFDRDSADPPTSNCTGECAETWPKVLVGEDSRLFIDRGIDRPVARGVREAGGRAGDDRLVLDQLERLAKEPKALAIIAALPAADRHRRTGR
jgi:hypothetical protein